MEQTDTIAQIITAPGYGAIGAVRISGDDALSIGQKLYSGTKDFTSESHRIYYGRVLKDEEAIDEALFLVMHGPKSYTGEDVVEIQCHGGFVAVQEVLKLVLREGARLAERGEFTRRAFLHGKLDLIEAEAVMDIVSAASDGALAQAMAQKEGKTTKKVESLRQDVLSLLAYLQADIDYPEDDIDRLEEVEVLSRATKLHDALSHLITEGAIGQRFREGVKIALVGKPNVGKSSLMNAILGKKRALVTEIAGTTRDVVSEHFSYKGLAMEIFDTAGIRETDDIVEKEGVALSKHTAQEADVVLFLYEAEKDFTADDITMLEALPKEKILLVRNKKDLSAEKAIRHRVMQDIPLFETSAANDQGIDRLLDGIFSHVMQGKEIKPNEASFNTRHIALMEKAKQVIADFIQATRDGIPQDLRVIDLLIALEKLGEITGENASDDLLDTIFSEFCLGK